MTSEPQVKRTLAFIDGQNLFYGAREAFGYSFPNYDALKLSEQICLSRGWQLDGVNFYTGIPDSTDSPAWNHFWQGKLAVMGRQGIKVFSRPLRYRNVVLRRPDGSAQTELVGKEKGIDVRIAIDILRCVYSGRCDIVLLFSQDQDLSEVAEEVKSISRQQVRWLKMASAFPDSPAAANRRGVNGTDWIRITRAEYDSCLDKRDYRLEDKNP